MVKALIIDDELNSIDALSILLADFCPQVQVLEQCNSVKKGLDAIRRERPDLVFLDIQMPVMNGFELLEQVSNIEFKIIFTTSYDQYAIKAIRASAMDYLLKPINSTELIAAVNKIERQLTHSLTDQWRILQHQLMNRDAGLTKIALPTFEGFELVTFEDILYCEADNNYSHLFLKDKKKITVCRTLKEVEEQLRDIPSFIRVHNSYIVNLNSIVKYIRGDGGYVVLLDGSTVNVSRTRKELLLKKLVPDR